MANHCDRLVVLGATGSIGASALEVVGELGDRIEVVGLACHGSWRKLAALAARWHPRAVAIADENAWREARSAAAFGSGVRILGGASGLVELAAMDDVDVVLNGIVGAAGLLATLAALEAGKRVALANKESLVVGGELVAAAAGGSLLDSGRVLPVDSEHNAIWQLLAGRRSDEVRRIVLTASGGPFRRTPAERLARVTPEEALAHPTWDMGPKITIDSATLANKGLEVIEAHHLFGLPYDRIDVVVHPQSIVHGLVEWSDGTLFAELGKPDMRVPIRSALAWPDRADGPHADLAELAGLTFESPDLDRFPALAIARAAGEAGGTAPAVFNAANEVAVALFLERRIAFPDIAGLCARVLDAHQPRPVDSITTLMEADRWAREEARARGGRQARAAST
ncbi:MAG TPA: 1-deoxy-D-xylulose-5-phosphate reductoisomerase [Gemmatimonadota bacterium]|nr:1-deoxy-D-xylulose-5-phosphate reductoisomerase [Gemmatimonadota bacterium]